MRGSTLIRPARCAAALAAALGLAGAMVATPRTVQANEFVSTAVCPGPLTWSFSAPLTLGFTPSGTVTQSWTEPSVCTFAGGTVPTSVAVPPFDEFVQLGDGALTGTASYSGSCVIADAGISSFQVGNESSLLIGGSVVVSPPTAIGPGETATEVDVLAPNSPCNETSATGVGIDVDLLTQPD
jgi:hypothetical protein